MKVLIVTADDFGLAPEVNRAIALAHEQGILTAASLMVSGPAAAEAVAIAKRLPTLRIGLHLVLTDGEPTLAPQRVPDLVDADGRLRRDMPRLGASIFFRPKVRAQAAAEIDAQFAAFARTGLALDHANGHHHFHVHPTIATLVLDIGRRYGLRAVRVPHEPAALLRTLEPQASRRADGLLAPWNRRLARKAHAARLTTNDRVIGLAWSGALTKARLTRALRELPDGSTEIYAHPATSDDFAASSRGYRYRDELDALVSIEAREAVKASGARTGGFSDFLLA